VPKSRDIQKAWRHRIIWAFSLLSAEGFAFYLYRFYCNLKAEAGKKLLIKTHSTNGGRGKENVALS